MHQVRARGNDDMTFRCNANIKQNTRVDPHTGTPGLCWGLLEAQLISKIVQYDCQSINNYTLYDLHRDQGKNLTTITQPASTSINHNI